MNTPNLNLQLLTLGQANWAAVINSNFDIINKHSHSITNYGGVALNVSHMKVSSDIDFTGQYEFKGLSINNIKYINFNNVIGQKNLNIYCNNNEFFFKDGFGNNIKITAGTSVNATAPGYGGFTGNPSFTGAEVVYVSGGMYSFFGNAGVNEANVVCDNIYASNLITVLASYNSSSTLINTLLVNNIVGAGTQDFLYSTSVSSTTLQAFTVASFPTSPSVIKSQIENVNTVPSYVKNGTNELGIMSAQIAVVSGEASSLLICYSAGIQNEKLYEKDGGIYLKSDDTYTSAIQQFVLSSYYSRGLSEKPPTLIINITTGSNFFINAVNVLAPEFIKLIHIYKVAA